MDRTPSRLEDLEKRNVVVERMQKRGVELSDIADITLDLQHPYVEGLDHDTCLDHVERVVRKREVQHAILTGLEFDELAEKDRLSEPLLSIIKNDYSLYGIDEILALAIVNVYGSIGFTNFGYVDKKKLGIIKALDDEGKKADKCHTFLDDIVGAIAAAAASSIAHRYG